MTTFNNYADVQAGLNAFVSQAGVNPPGAPHGAFWQTLTYTEFTTGNVPGVTQGGPWPILVIGDSKNSNIIQILQGVGAAAKRFRQMPRPRAPYEPEQTELITALAAWIDAGCPNPATAESTEHEGKLGVEGSAAPPAPVEFHVCMGLNSCAQQDVNGTAVMAGTGQCATVSHYCHTLNSCRGQGFCGGGGSTGAQQTQPGNNDCSGQGSCSTLAGPNGTVGPQWYMNQASTPPNPRQGPTEPPPGPYYGQKVWHVARQIFETRMYEQGRTFAPDGKVPTGKQANNYFGSSPQPDGPNPPPPDTPTK